MSGQLVRVTIRQPSPVTGTVNASSVKSVRVGFAGPAGQPGPPRALEWVQAVPAASWTVTHNMGRRPGGVSVYDPTDSEVETGVRVIDLNTIEITMASPMAGRVVVE